MFLRRLFSRRDGYRSAPAPFSADLTGDDAARLRTILHECLDRSGGETAAAQRSAGLVRLFGQLSPVGKARFALLLEEINDTGRADAMSRYSRIEEAELFGRPSSKLAIFDAFETPRRRLLIRLKDAPDGGAMLTALQALSGDGLAEDISALLSRR